MPIVVGVRLRNAARPLTFDAAGVSPSVGDAVVVRTERGEELGEAVTEAHEAAEGEVVAELKPVLRVATEPDLRAAEELREREREAMPVYREMVERHGLDMKPIDVECLFDGGKMIFYFVAEERVDFRELVRELSSRFKTRADMRQVGVRDEARLIGGLGHCGEQLCCVRFGGDFQPVSIRMAKEQDLPLNPLKISGLCGRLMCCLRYEYDAYKDFKGRAPKRGAIVSTPQGPGKVSEVNTPKETVTIRLESGTQLTVPLTKMGCCKGEGCPCSISEETFEELTGRTPVATLPVAEEPPASSAPAKAERPKRSRRRGKRGGGEGQQPPAKEPEPQKPAAPKAGGRKTGAQGPEAPKEGEAVPGRRRRRRRSSGEGGGSARQT